jgi:hypothetical protein
VNNWTELSIEYAQQKSYLDDLFKVYPTIPDGIREIDEKNWKKIEIAFKKQNNKSLIKELLKFELFPFKDAYVAYLRNDPTAIERNPKTINRLSGRLYDMGLKKIYDRCSEPKETNRQIGPMFRRWIDNKSLGIKPVKLKEFMSSKKDAILDAGDKEMKEFAKEKLNYHRNKGLDFLARFNDKYIIGEAKFLSAFGGSQNSDFEDAIATLEEKYVKAIRIAILDGVPYIKGKSKMYEYITDQYKDYNIMSALVLRSYLYQL